MAVLITYTIEKGGKCTPEQAARAQALLSVPTNQKFLNWSSSSTSNTPVSELQPGGGGVTMDESKSFYPAYGYKNILSYNSNTSKWELDEGHEYGSHNPGALESDVYAVAALGIAQFDSSSPLSAFNGEYYYQLPPQVFMMAFLYGATVSANHEISISDSAGSPSASGDFGVFTPPSSSTAVYYTTNDGTATKSVKMLTHNGQVYLSIKNSVGVSIDPAVMYRRG